MGNHRHKGRPGRPTVYVQRTMTDDAVTAATPGILALVGGGEWQPGCEFDADLVAASGADEVLVVPTAAAYAHPEHLVAEATAWFTAMGVRVRRLDVLRRDDALDPALAEVARASRFTYLAGRSSMHLLSVLKDAPVWEAIVAAWHDGGVLAGSSAGAIVVSDPMVDSRGGAFTLGLGLIAPLAVIPHGDNWSDERRARTLGMAPAGVPVAFVDERTALLRAPDGTWSTAGAGAVHVWTDSEPVDLAALPRAL